MLDRSKDFKRLRDEWTKKLAESGFSDLEDKKGNLKQYDIRTISFQNRDEICAFFLTLDHLMFHYPEMPQDEKAVLALWTQGIYATEIARRLSFGRTKVKLIIGRYKHLIVAINRLFQSGDHFPPF